MVSDSSTVYSQTPVPRIKWQAEPIHSQLTDFDVENPNGNDEPNSNSLKKQRCWPMYSQNSDIIIFCNESSMHGLNYVVQPKIHFTERLFWILAFLLSFAAAVYLIYEVWDRQTKVPVIISFQAKEQHIRSLPFPAVTICSMNRFPKSKVLQLEREAADPENANHLLAKKRLSYVRGACNSQDSFAKQHKFAYGRGIKPGDAENDTLSGKDQNDMIEYFFENTLDCGKFIRLCTFGEKNQSCSEMFKPIITDAGKCCSFNMLPLSLLFKNQTQNGTKFGNYFFETKHWEEWILDGWEEWDYKKGFSVPEDHRRPLRQYRAGMPHGLSILVDPKIEDFYCPVSDSMGIHYILHSPIEMPHVLEFASVADLGREVIVKVHPDVTNADEDIKDFEQKKRQCWFGKEKENYLPYYRPYTVGNCIESCNDQAIRRFCNCRLFYMPGYEGELICNNDVNSPDFVCIITVLGLMQKTSKDFCDSCNPLCDNIEYNYESTSAELQSGASLWGDPNPEYHPDGKPEWANHKMSILHIFYGSDTTTPKLRKRLYGITDLIANTGGILGLCLGFSVLSGVEVIYFLTLRAFWNYCRKRIVSKRIGKKADQAVTLNTTKVICVQSFD